MMEVEEVEPPVVMEASPTLLEGPVLRKELPVAIGSTSFTAPMPVSPVDVPTPQWLAKEGGLDITKAGKLAPVIASFIDVIEPQCTSVEEALAYLHRCTMKVYGVLLDGCNHRH